MHDFIRWMASKLLGYAVGPNPRAASPGEVARHFMLYGPEQRKAAIDAHYKAARPLPIPEPKG